MLKHTLIHPEINAILGRAGHHSKILIADGNYPASTKRGPNASLVCLNLSPGLVTVALTNVQQRADELHFDTFETDNVVERTPEGWLGTRQHTKGDGGGVQEKG